LLERKEKIYILKSIFTPYRHTKKKVWYKQTADQASRPPLVFRWELLISKPYIYKKREEINTTYQFNFNNNKKKKKNANKRTTNKFNFLFSSSSSSTSIQFKEEKKKRLFFLLIVILQAQNLTTTTTTKRQKTIACSLSF